MQAVQETGLPVVRVVLDQRLFSFVQNVVAFEGGEARDPTGSGTQNYERCIVKYDCLACFIGLGHCVPGLATGNRQSRPCHALVILDVHCCRPVSRQIRVLGARRFCPSRLPGLVVWCMGRPCCSDCVFGKINFCAW